MHSFHIVSVDQDLDYAMKHVRNIFGSGYIKKHGTWNMWTVLKSLLPLEEGEWMEDVYGIGPITGVTFRAWQGKHEEWHVEMKSKSPNLRKIFVLLNNTFDFRTMNCE